MQLAFEPSPLAPFVDLLVSFEEVLLLSTFDWNTFDKIWIIDVEDANLLITFV